MAGDGAGEFSDPEALLFTGVRMLYCLVDLFCGVGGGYPADAALGLVEDGLLGGG